MKTLTGKLAILGYLGALGACNSSLEDKLFQTDIRQKSYPLGYDSDGDTIPDQVELDNGLDPDVADAVDDLDGDGLSNIQEIKLGYDPRTRNSKDPAIGDCELDFDGDGAPNCWEIRFGFDPANAVDRVRDKDEDGFANAEEVAHDPFDATKHPGNHPVFVMSDGDVTVAGRTNSTAVKATYSYCAPGDALLFTASATAPAADDPAFFPCTTEERGLTGTLGSDAQGEQTMYVWRRNGAGVIESPTKATVTVDRTGPNANAGLTVSQTGTRTLTLTHVKPTDADYASVEIRRYPMLDCAASVAADGTVVTLNADGTTAVDGPLALATPYCYKAFWFDDLGNVAQSNPAVYDGTGPNAGSIAIASLAATAVSLTHTPPTDSDLASVTLRRNTSIPCASAAVTAGTGVPLGVATTAVTDASLSLATPYCYKAFWQDIFGNVTEGTATTSYDGVGPSGGALSFTSATSASVTLAHTAPTETGIGAATSVDLRRYTSACSAKTPSEGTAVAMALGATSVTDGSLTAATTYCYKAFWYDVFGNVTDTVVTNATTSPPATVSCSRTSSRNVWYVGGNASYTYTCNQTITAVTDPGTPSAWPSYLSVAVVGSTATLSGVPNATHGSTNFGVRFNNNTTDASATVATTAQAVNDVTFTTPATASLADAVTTEILSPLARAAVNAAYDGAPTLKLLMGNAVDPATHSNGAVGAAQTDITGLTYSDAAGACDGTVNKQICPTGSNYSSPNADAGFKLHWNYGTFDQGSYKVQTKGLMQADGARYYGAAATTRLATANTGAEARPVTPASSFFSSNQFYAAGSWFNYTPALALNDTVSTGTEKQVYAFVFPGNNTTRRRFAGVASIDRATSTSAFASTSWFNFTTQLSTQDPASVNTLSMAIASNSTDEWIALGTDNSGLGGRDLFLSAIDDNAGTPLVIDHDAGDGDTALNISAFSDSSSTGAVAIGTSFDDSGTARHGIAFFGYFADDGNGNAGATSKVYVSKIRSAPATRTEGAYFDAATYYQAAANDFSGVIESVPLTGDLATTASHVRLVNATEAGTKYFYVGWVNDTDYGLRFARVEASPVGVPVVRSIKAGQELTNFDHVSKGTLGRPAYAMAAGTDATGTIDLLGVLYTQDTDVADTSCKFQAYRVQDDGGTDRIQKWGAAREIGNSTECRFPNLFFNSVTRRFMAVYVEDSAADAERFETLYAEFQFDNTGASLGAGGAISPASPTEIIVTARTARPCQFAAHYSPVKHRIGMTSIEGACNASSHELSFDLYKTAQ